MTVPRPLVPRLLPLGPALGLLLGGCASPSPAAPAPGPAADRPAVPPAAAPGPALAGFAAARRADQLAYEAALREAVDPDRLRAWHDLLSSRPHVAGTPGDREVIAALAREMAAMGLAVEVQELDLYLPRPVRAELTVVAPQRVPLDLQEAALPEDPWSDHPELQYGWNAYSGSGTVEAGVVYANDATPEDFARLAELGVEVAGKIVVARYGRSFRGYKARFAEEAGAAGLVLYSDPEDAGYVRGRMWPAGGWANGTAIQRGSVLTLPYPGDPLTPFTAALAADDGAAGDTARLDPASVDFPGIPVQPVGWQAAAEILGRMTGPAVPEDWQGALPFNYRLTGGEALRVRLRVEQERELVRTANVVATLPGERFPDEKVIVGCHHDAWSFGAGDPNAGSILVLEAARAFAAAAAAGQRPDRSVVFAHWGAEEFGILGSVEWVEAHAGELAADAVAYVNLDMAAMGPRFGASATPSLADLVVAASREVAQAGEPGVSVHDAWAGDGEPRGAAPSVGALGGGSDHVGFYGHLGVPSISLGAGGSPGVSYHTNYEDLAWYRQVVGDDYQPARMLTDVVVTVAARLAEADLVPLAPAGYGEEAARRLVALAEQWEEGVAGERDSAAADPAASLRALAARAEEVAGLADRARRRADAAVAAGEVPPTALADAHRALIAADRAWVDPGGLPGRPWYRNLFAAPDADSGYAAWVLPELVAAVEAGDAAALATAARRTRAALDRLAAAAAALAAAVDPSAAAATADEPTRGGER